MNETITSLSDLPQNEREFADVIIEIVENKHKKYERDFQEDKIEHVPLENIHFGIADFEDFCNIMQGIAPYQDWKKTAQDMLGSLLWTYREIEPSRGSYRLSEKGRLYEQLAQKLGITQ